MGISDSGGLFSSFLWYCFPRHGAAVVSVSRSRIFFFPLESLRQMAVLVHVFLGHCISPLGSISPFGASR